MEMTLPRGRALDQQRRPVRTVHAAAPGHSLPRRRSLALHAVRLIASDVDGTLLNNRQELNPRVQQAILQAAEKGVPLVFATGKARGPWHGELSAALRNTTPSVLLQGLYICDADGTVLFNRLLEADVVNTCIEAAEQLGVTLAALTGKRVLAAAADEHTERFHFYREPPPEAVGDMRPYADQFNKLILMAPQPRIEEIRPRIEELLAGRATLTTAVEGMLEVLPLGASKGAGVAWLLDYMGVDAPDVMAIGDGENDVEMLQLAGVSVAMGNAGTRVQRTAQHVVADNDNDGLAEAIERFVLQQ